LASKEKKKIQLQNSGRYTEGPTQQAMNEFRIIAEHISTRDLVQEFLDFKVFPSLKEWEMPKLKGEKKEGELVRLPYYF
jgi:hypothetical protein